MSSSIETSFHAHKSMWRQQCKRFDLFQMSKKPGDLILIFHCNLAAIKIFSHLNEKIIMNRNNFNDQVCATDNVNFLSL